MKTKVLLSIGNPHWRRLRDGHRSWLRNFKSQYLANWEKLFKANRQAAMFEAAVRRWLEKKGVEVEPNESLTGRRRQADFKCVFRGHQFFVEATCISIANAQRHTGLPYPTQPGARHYRMLNDAIWSACKGKAAQCGSHSHPTLIAVGTFHASASALCFSKEKVNMLLTGETKFAWNVDTRSGRSVGDPYHTTDLRSAVFLRRSQKDQIDFARSSVSGILLCGFGIVPEHVFGILHPNAIRPFSRGLIPEVSFCEVKIDRRNHYLSTHWH